MQIVYVLKSEKDGNLYVGCTADLDKRIREHNRGAVKSTSFRRPLILVFQEKFTDKHEAFRVERYYKTAKGKRELKNKFS